MTATGRFCLGLPGTQEALSLRCKEPGSHQPPPPCIHAHSSMLIHAHETCFPLPAGDHCAAARRLNRKLRADAACPRRCLRPVDPHQQVSCRKSDWLGTSTAHNHTRVDASRVPFPVLCPSSPPCNAPSLPAERTRQCWECSASSRCLACASRTQRARCGRCRPALRVRCPGKDPRLTSGSAALGLPLACSTSEGWPGWQVASPKMMQQAQQAQQAKHAQRPHGCSSCRDQATKVPVGAGVVVRPAGSPVFMCQAGNSCQGCVLAAGCLVADTISPLALACWGRCSPRPAPHRSPGMHSHLAGWRGRSGVGHGVVRCRPGDAVGPGHHRQPAQ